LATHKRQIVEGLITLVVLGLVVALLRHVLSGVSLGDVVAVVRDLGPVDLALAALTTAVAYAALATYDVMGVRHAGVSLSPRRTARTSFISYVFNFNLGSAVGAVAMRLKLYGRHGVGKALVGRIVLFCVATSWSSYALLTGALLALAPWALPEAFAVPERALRPLGLVGVALALGYVLLCARGAALTWRGTRFALPSYRMALVQLGVGSLYWLSAASTLYRLLPDHAALPFAQVLGVYLFAAIAAVITHLPAGLGVLEGTFVLALTPELPKTHVLAGLLAFRVLFYLVPLLVAGAIYLVAEVRHHHAITVSRSRARASGRPPTDPAIRPAPLPPS
jgi:uncharacterized membrane protein YbhN (UPF0104 family)